MKQAIKFIFKPRLRAVILTLLLSGNILAQPDTLSFLHITDTHIISDLDFYHPGIAERRNHYGQGIIPLQQFIATVPKETNCDFITLTGDMIDFFEGQESDGEMLDFQIERFSRYIDECQVPIFMTLGNHDIVSYGWQDDKGVWSQKIAGRAQAAWSRNIECFRDGTYYSRQYEVSGNKYRLIFLYNGYNSFNPEEGIITPFPGRQQLHWLEYQIQQAEDDTEIIFMHIPIRRALKGEKPFSELYTVLAKYPSVKLIVAGHNHINAIQELPSAGNTKITQVQTGAFGRSIENWRLIKLTGDQILVSFPGRTEKEISIPAK